MHVLMVPAFENRKSKVKSQHLGCKEAVPNMTSLASVSAGLGHLKSNAAAYAQTTTSNQAKPWF